MSNKKTNNDPNRIEWMGMDGILVFGYFILVIIIFCSFKFRIDFLTAWVFPLVLLAIVLTVTTSYAKTLGSFIKMQNEKIKQNKERKE